MKPEVPSRPTLSDQELTCLLKKVAMQKAGIRNAASEDEIRSFELLEKYGDVNTLAGLLNSAKKLIQEVRNVFLMRNLVLLSTAIPVCLLIWSQHLFAWILLIGWIGIGSWGLAMSQMDQYFQLDNIIRVLRSIETNITNTEKLNENRKIGK